jgi:hypothetical protein
MYKNARYNPPRPADKPSYAAFGARPGDSPESLLVRCTSLGNRKGFRIPSKPRGHVRVFDIARADCSALPVGHADTDISRTESATAGDAWSQHPSRVLTVHDGLFRG